MSSLYKQYAEELFEQEMIEDDEGFASYRIYPIQNGFQMYVCDVFATKEARKRGKGKQLVDKLLHIALENYCTSAVTTIDPTTSRATENMKFHLSCKMRISHIADGLIYLVRDLREELKEFHND